MLNIVTAGFDFSFSKKGSVNGKKSVQMSNDFDFEGV